MRHDDDRARPLAQAGRQVVDAGRVEVVGRLVEQQQVRALPDPARQAHAVPLADAQLVEPAVRVPRRTEPRERLVDPPVGVPGRQVLVPATAAVRRARSPDSWSNAGDGRLQLTGRGADPAEGLRDEASRWSRRRARRAPARPTPACRSGAPRPVCGASSPASTRSSVVLPAPFSPTTPTRSPALTDEVDPVQHGVPRVAVGDGVGDELHVARGALSHDRSSAEHPHERRDQRAERGAAVADRVLLLRRQLRARAGLARRARGSGRSRSRRPRAARWPARPRACPSRRARSRRA